MVYSQYTQYLLNLVAGLVSKKYTKHLIYIVHIDSWPLERDPLDEFSFRSFASNNRNGLVALLRALARCSEVDRTLRM